MKKREKRTKSFCITVPPELGPVIRTQALASGRTVSAYLSWLIRQDTDPKKDLKNAKVF